MSKSVNGDFSAGHSAPLGRKVNLQRTSDLRIRDASLCENLNLYPVIESQMSVCCQNGPPVA